VKLELFDIVFFAVLVLSLFVPDPIDLLTFGLPVIEGTVLGVYTIFKFYRKN
jgi:hypothetical protein